jgi:hypothetical protein
VEPLEGLPHLRRAVDAQEEFAFHAEHIRGKRFRAAGLKEHNEQICKRTRIRPRGVDPERAAVRDEEIFGLILDELSQGSRLRSVVRARSVLCYWAVAFFSTERSKAGILVQQVDFGKTDPAQEVQLIAVYGIWGQILISDYNLSDSCAGDTLPAWYMCGGSSMKKLFPRRTMGVDAGATLLDLCLRCVMV